MRLCTSPRAAAKVRQTLDINLALGEADVQSGVLLEGGLEIRKNVEAVVRKS